MLSNKIEYNKFMTKYRMKNFYTFSLWKIIQFVVTNYIVTNDPYYKLHYLVTIILFSLLYFNYLKDQEFEEYEDRFVVFTSKYILMPLIIGFIVSTVFFYIVQLWQ